jgi:hypothetical protein
MGCEPPTTRYGLDSDMMRAHGVCGELRTATGCDRRMK